MMEGGWRILCRSSRQTAVSDPRRQWRPRRPFDVNRWSLPTKPTAAPVCRTALSSTNCWYRGQNWTWVMSLKPTQTKCFAPLSCLSVCNVGVCGPTVGWIKMKLGKELGLGPGHTVLDGTQLPPPKKGHSPKFSAHVCCGQTAGWIKMKLGKEVGLRPGDIVLDRDPAPLQKREGQHQPPLFGPCLLGLNDRPSQLLLMITCVYCQWWSDSRIALQRLSGLSVW